MFSKNGSIAIQKSAQVALNKVNFAENSAKDKKEKSVEDIRKAVETEQKEKKQIVRRPQYPNFSIKYTVLKDLENEEEEDSIDASLPKDDFSAVQFKNFWNQYLTKLKTNNKPAYNVMQTSQWLIKPNLNLELTFDSSVMILEFEKIKDDFTKAVRETLNNYYIQVESKVTTKKEVKSHIKTKKEIYENMVKKNPVIEKLRISLGLDLGDDF